MKKMIVALGIFAAGSIIQLIMGTIFLFSQVELISELCVMAALLAVSVSGLVILDIFQKQTSLVNSLTDNFRMLVYHCGRLATILLIIETLNVLIIGVSFLFSVPLWIQAVLLLAMVLVFLIAVVVIFLVTREEPSKRKNTPNKVPSAQTEEAADT